MQKEKLMLLRKQKGFTQQQIADVLATDVSNYSRKEGGIVKITENEWEKLATFFNVPLEDILDESFKNTDNNFFVSGTKNFSNLTDGTNNLNDDFSIELVKNLLDYIRLLKIEIKNLKDQIG